MDQHLIVLSQPCVITHVSRCHGWSPIIWEIAVHCLSTHSSVHVDVKKFTHRHAPASQLPGTSVVGLWYIHTMASTAAVSLIFEIYRCLQPTRLRRFFSLSNVWSFDSSFIRWGGCFLFESCRYSFTISFLTQHGAMNIHTLREANLPPTTTGPWRWHDAPIVCWGALAPVYLIITISRDHDVSWGAPAMSQTRSWFFELFFVSVFIVASAVTSVTTYNVQGTLEMSNIAELHSTPSHPSQVSHWNEKTVFRKCYVIFQNEIPIPTPTAPLRIANAVYLHCKDGLNGPNRYHSHSECKN